LVLNAGVNAHSFFEEFEDLRVFKKIMDVNFYGYVYCTKYRLFLNKDMHCLTLEKVQGSF